MNQTQNGVVVTSDYPVKKTFKQDRNCTVNHHHSAILRTSPKRMVCRNTFVIRLNRPESAVLSCPNSVTGLWADGPFREAGRTAITSVTNICPPAFARNEAADSKTRYRSMTMPKSTTTGATAQTTHDHHQAALVLRAQNHLALALFELRNNTGTTPTRKAMGLAYAAGRALSQVVGGAV